MLLTTGTSEEAHHENILVWMQLRKILKVLQLLKVLSQSWMWTPSGSAHQHMDLVLLGTMTWASSASGTWRPESSLRFLMGMKFLVIISISSRS